MRRSDRAVIKALTLAAEQHEQHLARWAMRLVRKCERKINVPRLEKRKGRVPAKTVVPSEAKTAQKTARSAIENILGSFRYKFQNALRRCSLMKRAQATFRMPMSREDFFKLLAGCLDMTGEGDADEEQCCACMQDVDRKDAIELVTSILGVESDWWCRRCYGRRLWKRRDCAHLDFRPDHPQRNTTRFRWFQRHISQLDHDGNEHKVMEAHMQCHFPRNVTAVKPNKKFKRPPAKKQL